MKRVHIGDGVWMTELGVTARFFAARLRAQGLIAAPLGASRQFTR